MTFVTRADDPRHCRPNSASVSYAYSNLCRVAGHENLPCLRCVRSSPEVDAGSADRRSRSDRSRGREAAAELAESLAKVRVAAIRLWSQPATGPSDLILKARALRWHFPDGIEFPSPTLLGAADDPAPDAPLGAIAVHYIVKDLLALSM